MIQLSVNGTEYNTYESWSEMPLSKAVELAKLCNTEMPGSLKSLYALYAKHNEKNTEAIQEEIKALIAIKADEDAIKNEPAFYGKVIKCMSTIPEDVVDKISSGNRVIFYQQYLYKFVFGVLHFPTDIEYKGIESFNHKDVTYHLPKSKTVLGEVKPFADRTAIEFAESTDLELFSKQLDGGKLERAANIIAILCRPFVPKTIKEFTGGKKNLDISKTEDKKIIDKLNGWEYDDWYHIEPYNEDICLKRAEEFMDLKMDTVWEVFFCLQQHTTLSKQNTAISSLEEALSHLKQGQQADMIS